MVTVARAYRRSVVWMDLPGRNSPNETWRWFSARPYALVRVPMIDLINETLVPLAEVPELLPRRRNGKPIHTSTVFRWATRGCRGVRLEVVRIGGRLYISSESLQRFAQRLTDPGTKQVARTTRQRARDIARAGRVLSEAGIQ